MPLQRDASVIAPAMPARDQPVPAPSGARSTESESTVPMAAQVISARAATSGQWCGAGAAAVERVEVMMSKPTGGDDRAAVSCVLRCPLHERVEVGETSRPAELVHVARRVVVEAVVHKAQLGAARLRRQV